MRRAGLRQRHPGPDLYRDRPGQRRHAVRTARHHGDRDVERRHLCDHPGHARRIGELRAELCRRQPHRDGGAAHRHRECADDRIYGAAIPALTYNETGLVNGDTLSGLLATTATTTSNVGSYGITQGTLAASAELRAELCRRQSHRHRGAAHGHRECADAWVTAAPFRP